MLNRVLLPAPLFPSKAILSPSSIEKDTPFNTAFSLNDFVIDGRIAAAKAVEDIHQTGQTIEQYFREEMNKGGEQA